MTDPYLQDDGRTLRNKLGIWHSPQLLKQAEADLVAIRENELRRNGFPQAQGLELVKAIYRHLFQDVYDWPGVPSTTPLFKHNQAGQPGDTDDRLSNIRLLDISWHGLEMRLFPPASCPPSGPTIFRAAVYDPNRSD